MERRWLASALTAVAVLGPHAATAGADEASSSIPTPPPAAEAPQADTPAAATPPAAVAASQQVALAAQDTPIPAAPEAVEEEPEEKFSFGGQTDFYFTSNLNDPFDGRNALRAWDIKDEHGPHLGLIELWGQYERDPVGFRFDLNLGPTARLNNATEVSDDKWLQYFQQLYVSVNLNKEGSTYFDFGKYVTPIGAEVIEPAGNWFYSQGVIFTWPIPFWHFGGRLYHYFNDTDYVMAHVNHGWGTVTKPDDAGLNFGLTGSKMLSPKMTVTGSYLGGDNFAGLNDPSWRNLFNAVVAYTRSETSKWSYLVDMTLGTQSDFRLKPGPSSTATWYGIQAQTKYQLRPDQYVAGRAEYLHDADGALFGDDLDLFTLSANYTKKFTEHLQLRLEYRHDFAGGGQPFADSRRNTFTSDQGTFIVGAIVTY